MFSEKLKALRTAKKMSQKDLADKVGVAKSVVSFYESGDRFPSYDVLIKISRIFNVTTDYLLGAAEDEIAPKAKTPGTLKPDENELLDLYRQLPFESKQRLIARAEVMLENANTNHKYDA